MHNFASCGDLLQAWGWSRMSRLSPTNPNPFQFLYATKCVYKKIWYVFSRNFLITFYCFRWSVYGWITKKIPHHCAPGYQTFFDLFDSDDVLSLRLILLIFKVYLLVV